MSSPPSKSTPLRRGRIGTNVFLQILLGLVIFSVVNYLAFRHHQRWDLTQSREHTLSEKTIGFLDSLEQSAKLVVVFGSSSPILHDVRVLTDEYKSNGKVTVEFVDPVRSPEALQELYVRYDTHFSGNTLIVESGDRTKFLTENELANYDTSHQSRRRVLDFHGEDAVTSALISVTESSQRRLYIVKGKGAPRIGATGSAADVVLQQITRKQNIDLQIIDLANIDAIPDDAAGIVILAPQTDFTRTETALLETYWKDRGSILVLRDPIFETPTLDRFLAGYGIAPRNDRVLAVDVTPLAQQKIYSVRCNFVPVEDLPITAPLLTVTTELAGQSSSLDLAPREKFLKESGILVTPLLEATDRYWGETRYQLAVPRYDPGSDTANPVFLAAAAERGAARDARIRIQSSRLVVVGNATLIDPDTLLQQNEDFIANSINWLLDREELIGIAPKYKKRYKIDITEAQRSKIFLLTTVLLPATVFCFGLFVWSSRRS